MLITKEDPNSDICPECNGDTLSIREKGQTVCCQCGLIVYERELDLSHAGLRILNKRVTAKRVMVRTPITPLIPDLRVCTFIDKKRVYNFELKRAVKRDTHYPWESRNLIIALNELRRISNNLNLPKYIKESAFNLYKKAFKLKILKGRTIIGMVIACVYYSCKKMGLPRTFQEILNESPINKKMVKMCYKTLINNLNLKAPSINPISLIPRFITDLGLNIDIERAAIKLLQSNLEKNSICGKDPKGFCAGAIYFASKIKHVSISQKVIAQKVGVSEVTLRSRYKELTYNLS